MKAKELREMSDEQLEATVKEAAETMFNLGMQAQRESVTATSLTKKNRRLIARVRTLQTERTKAKA